jgi:hypothetical protein
VKPATPPSGRVGNASDAACSIAYGSETNPRFHIAGKDASLASASSLKTDSATDHVMQSEHNETLPEEGAAETIDLEVRGLSGETFVKTPFQPSESVLSVKEKVQTARGIPIWQQMLSFQGEMLNDQSKLGELRLLHGAVLDLVLRSGPSSEDMEALADIAKESLTAGMQAMHAVTKRDVMEVRAFAKPPMLCEKVMLAALHLLAGLAKEIPTKRDGSPKNPDWVACKIMMKDPIVFMKQVLELPSCIDDDRVRPAGVAKARQLINGIEGDSEATKITNVGRCSLMCQQLLAFLIGVVKYYDGVAEFRERFGGATVAELKSRQ